MSGKNIFHFNLQIFKDVHSYFLEFVVLFDLENIFQYNFIFYKLSSNY